MLKHKWLLLLLALCLHAPALAANRVALVIGNAAYQAEPLRNPVNDAQDMRSTLTGLGFDVTYVENSTRKSMLRAVQKFRKKLQGHVELAFFYYAGHGAQFEKHSYLIPLGAEIADAGDLPIEAIKAGDILAQMQRSASGINVMVLDACRNLPFPLPGKDRDATRGLARIDAKGSQTLVAYSTAAGAVANDGNGRNSPYTASLLKHLVKPGLSLTELFNDVGVEVSDKTGQTPWLSLSPIPRLYLAGNSAQPPQKPVVKPEPVRQSFEPEMVFIKGGDFTMGSPENEKNRGSDETHHEVSVSDFFLGKYEVTVGEYLGCVEAKACSEPKWREAGNDYHIETGTNDYYKKLVQDHQQPIVGVSWNNAVQYANWMKRRTGKNYRLPTEAEWEYAARAGTGTTRYWGNDIGSNQANCDGCGSRWDNKTTAPVGQFVSNPWGLHDMLGNVWEWTCSAYEKVYDRSELKCVNGSDTRIRVLRGGSWDYKPWFVRSANRDGGKPAGRNDGVGFRLSRTP